MAKQAANDSIKTQLNGPWPGVKAMEKPTKNNSPVDLSTVKKTHTPYIVPRVDKSGKKYDALFFGVKEGDCFECPPNKCANIAKALRVYCRQKNIEGIVKQNSRCEDGIGRVWLYKVIQHRKAA